jgi:hypothetical protein
MLAADGSVGGTDFYSMDVPTMWALVANQDTTAHYQLLSGWQRSYELILQHMAQVQNYRDNLATAWPPEKSPASAAYIAELDGLVANLQKTYDATIANHTAFAGATLSLSLSRNDLKKIYDQYAANQTKLDAFNAAPKPLSSGKAVAPPLKPPVAAGQQEQLNNQARVLMSKLSTDLAQAQTSLTTPPAFDPARFQDVGKKDEPTQTYTPPVIPPVIPTESNAGASSSHGSSISPITVPASSPIAGVRQPGLVLGGIDPLIATSPTPATPLPTGTGPLPNVISQAPILPPAPFPSGTPTAPGVMRSLPGEGIGRSGISAGPVGGVRAMPAGGVIGGAPGVGPGRPALGRGSSAQRVNPIGGVIGSSSGDSGSGPRGSSTGGQSLSNLAGRTGRRGKADESTAWDPDNPWETSEGVAPVVLPVAEQRVNPGPAIGLD